MSTKLRTHLYVDYPITKNCNMTTTRYKYKMNLMLENSYLTNNTYLVDT